MDSVEWGSKMGLEHKNVQRLFRNMKPNTEAHTDKPELSSAAGSQAGTKAASCFHGPPRRMTAASTVLLLCAAWEWGRQVAGLCWRAGRCVISDTRISVHVQGGELQSLYSEAEEGKLEGGGASFRGTGSASPGPLISQLCPIEHARGNNITWLWPRPFGEEKMDLRSCGLHQNQNSCRSHAANSVLSTRRGNVDRSAPAARLNSSPLSLWQPAIADF